MWLASCILLNLAYYVGDAFTHLLASYADIIDAGLATLWTHSDLNKNAHIVALASAF